MLNVHNIKHDAAAKYASRNRNDTPIRDFTVQGVQILWINYCAGV